MKLSTATTIASLATALAALYVAFAMHRTTPVLQHPRRESAEESPFRHARVMKANSLDTPVSVEVANMPATPTPIAAASAGHREIDEANEPPRDDTPVSDEERRAYAESVFDAQSVDAGWALSSKRGLQAALPAVLGPEGKIRELECRSSLCRLTIEHPTLPAQQTFLRRLAQSATWSGPGMAVRDQTAPPGTERVFVYLAQDGTLLPERPAD